MQTPLPSDFENTNMMQTTVRGSEKIPDVNVFYGEFKTRKSVENRKAIIPNSPLNSPQCKLKFSQAATVYIVQNYEG